MYKKQFVLILFLIFISCKKKEITRENISIPHYYSNYDFRKFWEPKGVSFLYSNYKPNNNKYKDSTSTNFFSLDFGFANIMNVPKKDRANFIAQELDLKPYEINNSYEIYKGETVESATPMKGLHRYVCEFIILNDSVVVNVTYESFDLNKRKLNDYNKIIEQITKELKDGSHFKTKEKKWNSKTVIAN